MYDIEYSIKNNIPCNTFDVILILIKYRNSDLNTDHLFAKRSVEGHGSLWRLGIRKKNRESSQLFWQIWFYMGWIDESDPAWSFFKGLWTSRTARVRLKTILWMNRRSQYLALKCDFMYCVCVCVGGAGVRICVCVSVCKLVYGTKARTLVRTVLRGPKANRGHSRFQNFVNALKCNRFYRVGFNNQIK